MIVTSAQHVRAARPVLLWALAIVLILAIALIVGGIFLVYLGSTGSTQMSLFGNAIKTQSVGVVGLVTGLILGVLGLRSALSAVVKLARIPPDRNRR